MDPLRFDRLAKSLSAPGTRRALVRVLLGVPLAGSLAGLLEAEEAGAERPLDRVRRRAQRKQEKRHNPGQYKDNPTHKRRGRGGKGGTLPRQGRWDLLQRRHRDLCGRVLHTPRPLRRPVRRDADALRAIGDLSEL